MIVSWRDILFLHPSVEANNISGSRPARYRTAGGQYSLDGPIACHIHEPYCFLWI